MVYEKMTVCACNKEKDLYKYQEIYKQMNAHVKSFLAEVLFIASLSSAL